MSSVFSLDDDPIVIVVPSSAAIPPGNITESEWLAIKDRVTVVEGYGLGDLGDVALAGIENGQVLLWDQATETWIPGSAATPIDGYAGTNLTPGPVSTGVRELFAGTGLAGRAGTGGVTTRYVMDVVFGNTATTVAAGNHTHTQPLPTRVTTAPSGYISGGSQPLGSTAVTLPNGIACVVEAELYGQFRGADSGAAYYTVSITIGGNTFTSPGGASGFWCVQGVPDKINWEHERKITGTGSAVSVSASVAWHSGSGFNIDRTYLKVRVRPDR